jgi:hypothetical protein
MASDLAGIANNAGGRIGGFGDQLSASGQITASQLTANADPVSQWINEKYPIIRRKVIADFAGMKAPFKETRKFASLGPDLKQSDVAITSITSVATVVTVTTKTAHGRITGDTGFLAEIEGVDVEGQLITSLNGTTPTITVLTTTTFTLDGVAGVDATWDYTADTGIISYVPEIGAWNYAFKLPSDYFAAVRQTDESLATTGGVKTKYQFKAILNRDGDGFLWLTNDLTNNDGDSAYIEYCIDQTTFTLFSPGLEESIAMLLAAELCPNLGRNLETRQQLLLEYKQLTVKEAKRNNQSQLDTTAHVPSNYLGGRTKRISGISSTTRRSSCRD